MRKYIKSHNWEFWVNLDEIALGENGFKQHFTPSLNERKIRYTVPLSNRFELMILSFSGLISVLISDCFTFHSHTLFPAETSADCYPPPTGGDFAVCLSDFFSY